MGNHPILSDEEKKSLSQYWKLLHTCAPCMFEENLIPKLADGPIQFLVRLIVAIFERRDVKYISYPCLHEVMFMFLHFGLYCLTVLITERLTKFSAAFKELNYCNLQ